MLDARQQYILRKRLDHDHFPIMCDLERHGQLRGLMACCSFCLTLHKRNEFASAQLKVAPEDRICRATAKEYLILGAIRTCPAALRDALEDIVYIRPQKPKEFSASPVSSPLRHNGAVGWRSTIKIPWLSKSLSIDDSGLVVRCLFPIQTRNMILWQAGILLRHFPIPTEPTKPLLRHVLTTLSTALSRDWKARD